MQKQAKNGQTHQQGRLLAEQSTAALHTPLHTKPELRNQPAVLVKSFTIPAVLSTVGLLQVKEFAAPECCHVTKHSALGTHSPRDHGLPLGQLPAIPAAQNPDGSRIHAVDVQGMPS